MKDGPGLTFDGAVARIDLGRPTDGNRLTRAMMAELAGLIGEAARRHETRLVGIQATGDVFCGGRDGRGETSSGLSGHEIRSARMQPVLDVYTAIRTAAVPVVACVHADAIGFGAALAGACDVTVASSRAGFAFPEITKDIAPTMAMSAVRRKVQEAALSYLILTGERIDALRARECGLVGVVFEADEYEHRLQTMMEALSSRPRPILETIKKYMRESSGMHPDAAADYAGALLALTKA